MMPVRRRVWSVPLILMLGLASWAGRADADTGVRTLAVAIGGRHERLIADEVAAATLPITFEPGTSRLDGAGQRAVRRLAAARAELFAGGGALLVAVQVPADRQDAIPLAVQRAQVIRDRLVLTLKAAPEDAVMAAVLVGGDAASASADAPRVFFAPVTPADGRDDPAEVRRRMRTLALDSMFAARAVARWDSGSAPAPAPVAATPPATATPPAEAVAALAVTGARPAVPRDPDPRPAGSKPAAAAGVTPAPRPAARPAPPQPRVTPSPREAPRPQLVGQGAQEETRPVLPQAPSPRPLPHAPRRPVARPYVMTVTSHPSVQREVVDPGACGPATEVAAQAPRPAAAPAPVTCVPPAHPLDDFYPGGPIVPCPVR